MTMIKMRMTVTMMMVSMICWQFKLTADPDDEDHENDEINDELAADCDNDDDYEV